MTNIYVNIFPPNSCKEHHKNLITREELNRFPRLSPLYTCGVCSNGTSEPQLRIDPQSLTSPLKVSHIILKATNACICTVARLILT
ncbi:hypothetical protein Mapa_010851 [Marchantia paleacea]|nr:hypothetical protein Mapa_010851 [Marchantia paleacea]